MGRGRGAERDVLVVKGHCAVEVVDGHDLEEGSGRSGPSMALPGFERRSVVRADAVRRARRGSDRRLARTPIRTAECALVSLAGMIGATSTSLYVSSESSEAWTFAHLLLVKLRRPNASRAFTQLQESLVAPTG
jgi:hypothetical protein